MTQELFDGTSEETKGEYETLMISLPKPSRHKGDQI